MRLSSRKVPISGGGYEWTEEGDVVDVDTWTATELLAIPGNEFYTPEEAPEPAKVPRARSHPKKADDSADDDKEHPLKDVGSEGDLTDALEGVSPTRRRSKS
jgi:hypothetical protein